MKIERLLKKINVMSPLVSFSKSQPKGKVANKRVGTFMNLDGERLFTKTLVYWLGKREQRK